jgi:hypothetical protein
VPVRFKVDENLPDEMAEMLSALGHDAVTVRDQGWQGMADDRLWRLIQAEGRWLVTADKEFADLRRRPPGTHAGILLLRPNREGLDEYLGLATDATRQLDFSEIAGSVVVVGNRGVRLRRPSNG